MSITADRRGRYAATTKYHPATMSAPTYTSFIPIRACANIEPSRSTASPATAATTGDAKSRLARSTTTNARSAAKSTPGMRQASA